MGGWTPPRGKERVWLLIGCCNQVDGGRSGGSEGCLTLWPGLEMAASRVVFGVRAAGGTRLVMCSGGHKKWRSGAQFPLLLPSMPCPHT